MNARCGAVEGELADRDGDAARALITEPKDSLIVRDDDQADLAPGSCPQDLVDPADVVGRDPHAARPAEDVTEFLAGTTDRRCVDDGKELLEVVDEDAVEEGLVSVLEGGEPDISLEVVALSADVLELERHLIPDNGHAGRQQPS